MHTDEEAMPPVTFYPIGVIRSPHLLPDKTPIQPVYARGVEGRAEILSDYVDGLQDLAGFSHVLLVYWFHRATTPRLIVKPFLDDVPRGVFATRAPCRPNPIGISVVRLIRQEANVLYLEDVDMLDGTPLLDIKPYVSRFECREGVRCGWVDSIDEPTAQERTRGRNQWRAEGK